MYQLSSPFKASCFRGNLRSRCPGQCLPQHRILQHEYSSSARPLQILNHSFDHSRPWINSQECRLQGFLIFVVAAADDPVLEAASAPNGKAEVMDAGVSWPGSTGTVEEEPATGSTVPDCPYREVTVPFGFRRVAVSGLPVT